MLLLLLSISDCGSTKSAHASHDLSYKHANFKSYGKSSTPSGGTSSKFPYMSSPLGITFSTGEAMYLIINAQIASHHVDQELGAEYFSVISPSRESSQNVSPAPHISLTVLGRLGGCLKQQHSLHTRLADLPTVHARVGSAFVLEASRVHPVPRHPRTLLIRHARIKTAGLKRVRHPTPWSRLTDIASDPEHYG